MDRLFQKLFLSKLQTSRELDEDSLPFPIASGIFLEKYNSFIKIYVMPDGTCRGTDLAIGPHPNFVPNPPVLHPGPPPSNIKVLLICHVFCDILNTIIV
ncbi:hypothetical protein RIR_jg9028.t1 [Rhizophagus irregularis DAOM 181602=DAOM 197198]|nr:hypothetical protein RIR_jg9028.t1 [Rhizophagus irregularis DAOM 181602=DAOM 197198]